MTDAVIARDGQRLALLEDLTARAHEAGTSAVALVLPAEAPAFAQSWGWWRFLASLAKTEGLEDRAMEGLDRGLAQFAMAQPVVLAYVASHRADEHRHGEMITGFLAREGADRPRYRSASDVLLYGVGLRLLQLVNRFDPLYVLLALLLYERAALEFYRQAIALAERDGYNAVAKLLHVVRADEGRHLAGVDVLLRMRLERRRAGPLTRAAVAACTRVVLWDLDYGDHARHNSGLRRAFAELGFDREAFSRHMADSRQQALDLVGAGPAGRR